MTIAAVSANPYRQEGLADLFQAAKIIPVITIERVEDAVPLAQALVAGGLRCLEITLRTPAAAEAVKAVITNVPEAIIGVGTVLTPRDLALAHEIGARFALSPGATPEPLDATAACDLPFVPGVATAPELMAALARGLDVVKFFPAVPAGGVAALRALAGPFPQARFCPTSGVSEINVAEWLALSNVVAVGGSWFTPPDEISRGDWSAITERARQNLAQFGA